MKGPNIQLFRPKGKEIFVSTILLAVICLSGFATYSRMLALIDEEIACQGTFSTCSFDWSKSAIPANMVFHVGPPKDGIPALKDPKMIPAGEAAFLEPEDRVIGVEVEGRPLAFPLRVLARHECVNGTFGGAAYAVVYCPLSDSAAVFDRDVKGETLEFGISGLMYQNNLLLFDRRPNQGGESLWSQMRGMAVAGPKTGTRLETIPHQLVRWSAWRIRHPDTLVLSNETGHRRTYPSEFYRDYFRSSKLKFPVSYPPPEVYTLFPLKERVAGVVHEGVAKAYPIERMRFDRGPVRDEINGKPVVLYQTGGGDVWIECGEGVRAVHGFWFAWCVFQPDTLVYSGNAFDLPAWIRTRNPSALPVSFD